MNFDEYLSKTLINEEFHIDMHYEELDHMKFSNPKGDYYKNIPIAINPTKDEFIKIAKDYRSSYYHEDRVFHGIRIGVIDFWEKDSVPDLYIFPGGLFHISIYMYLRNHHLISYRSPFNRDHAWDSFLSWDESMPNVILTEYAEDIDLLTFQNNIVGNNLYYKKFLKMFEKLFPIKSIKLQSTLENILVFPKELTSNKKMEINLTEPSYASDIRTYHSS